MLFTLSSLIIEGEEGFISLKRIEERAE